MKKMIATVLAATSFASQANELITFNTIADAINEGKDIRFVMNFKQCTSSERSLGASIGRVAPNMIMVIDNNRITAAERHFTLDNPESRGKPTFDFSKFTINAEGNASIKVTIMNALNYDKLSSFLIHCKLGEGFKVFS